MANYVITFKWWVSVTQLLNLTKTCRNLLSNIIQTETMSHCTYNINQIRTRHSGSLVGSTGRNCCCGFPRVKNQTLLTVLCFEASLRSRKQKTNNVLSVECALYHIMFYSMDACAVFYQSSKNVFTFPCFKMSQYLTTYPYKVSPTTVYKNSLLKIPYAFILEHSQCHNTFLSPKSFNFNL